MSCAFYSEQQIYPWARDPELVMFAINWTDREDMVCHVRRPDCDREDPHEISRCGRFDWNSSTEKDGTSCKVLAETPVSR